MKFNRHGGPLSVTDEKWLRDNDAASRWLARNEKPAKKAGRNFPGPLLSGDAGGHRGIPSSEADGAKMASGTRRAPDRAGEEPGSLTSIRSKSATNSRAA